MGGAKVPFSLDDERNILASFLSSPMARKRIMERLTCSDFSEVNARLYQALLDASDLVWYIDPDRLLVSIEVVKERSVRRQLIAASANIIRNCNAGDPPGGPS